MKTPLLIPLIVAVLTQLSIFNPPPLHAQSPLPDDFNPGADDQAYFRVYSLAVQADGKILAGGWFTKLGGQLRNYLGRLNSDGTLDSTFNPGANDWVYSLAMLPDGKILVGGDFTTLGGLSCNGIGRLHPDGTLDSTFNPGAGTFPFPNVHSLALQADGRILVGGWFTKLDGQRRDRIGRLHPDGTLDSTFNPGAGGTVLSLALQADGRILVGGWFTSLGGQPRNYLGRLNPDGTSDSTFNPVANNWVSSLAVQADGKILVGGGFTTLNWQPRNQIGRLNPDGTLDSSFNPGAGGSYPNVSSLAVQADGRVLVGGSFTNLGGQPRYYLGRLNPDGTLDSTFNPGADNLVDCLALQADGKVLVGGAFTTLGGQPRNRIGRLNNTELVSQTLTNDGSTITWLRGGTSPEVWRTTFEHSSNGSLWTFLGAGIRIPGGWQRTGVALPAGGTVRARGYSAGGYYNASGGLVESYAGRLLFVSQPASRTNDAGTTARFWVAAGGSEPLSYQWFKGATPLANQGNVAGATSPLLTLSDVLKSDEGAYRVVLNNAFGSLTSTVATLTVMDPFILVPPMGTNLSVGDSVTLSVTAGGTPPFNYQWYHDGLAVPGATGSTLTFSILSGADAGYYTVQVSNAQGSVSSSPVPLTVNVVTADPDFNPGGNNEVYFRGNCLAEQADGKILVGGYFSTLGGQPHHYLGRLNPDGTLDSAFNPAADNWINCLAVQSDGKILVAGDFSTLGGQPRNRIGRINPDGTLDSTFNPGAGGDYPYVYSLALQSDGKILVGGRFTTLGGGFRNNLGRLNPNGTLDSTFNPGTGGDYPTVYSLALQADGKIVVGGSFTTLGGQPRSSLGRLNPNGTVDSTFNPGANARIHSLAVQPDGKILVGGQFNTLGGQPRNYLGRLNLDGTLDSTFNAEASFFVYSMALQADGKILVGGNFTMLGGQPRSQIGRLHPDGTLDSTFNPEASGDYPSVYALALQVDGRILVGGDFTSLAGQPRNGLGRLNNTAPATQTLTNDSSTITWLRGGTSPEVWRTTVEHSADGSNWTFLGAGLRIPGGWQLTGVSLPADRTVRARGYAAGGYHNASGWFTESYAGRLVLVSQPVSRTNDAGTTARFWAVAGGTEPLSYQWFKDATPLANQEKVSGATSPTLTVSNVIKADEGAYRVVVSRDFASLTSAVATLTVMDPAILVPPMSTNLNVGESVTLSVTAGGTPPLNYRWYHDGLAVPGADGPTLAFNGLSAADAGYYSVQVSNVHGSVSSSPVSLTVNMATTDADFHSGVGGCWGEDCEPSVSALALQADGKILVGGRFSWLGGQPRISLGRLNPDGTQDATFDPRPGEVSEDGDSGPSVSSLAVQADGKILMGGGFGMLGGQPRNCLGRLNPDGTLDSAFNPGADSSVESLAVQADKKILVGGYFSTLGGQPRKGIGRLNPDGTLDSTFDPGTGGSYPYVYCLVVQADGKILVGGYFTSLGGQPRNSLGRLNPDGTLDSTFNPAADGAYPNVFSLALQADGKILVGGYFTTLGGQPRNGIGRLNPDGTLDATFNPGAGGYDPKVRSLAVQADGRILVGGHFSTLGGQLRDSLARLNPDGTLDSTFNPGPDEGDDYGPSVSSLALQADGRILMAGRFTTVGGQPRHRIARLNNTAPATQTLTNDGTTITWLRGGTSPEVWRTTFEHSSDGLDWVFLGDGTRIPGGWQLTGGSLLAEGTLRARGYAAGGEGNASGWFMESYAGRLLFVSQPASRTNDAGTTARFEVVAGGTEPLSYQWFKGATPLANQGNVAGATSPTLTVSGVLKPDEGGYWVVVSDASGSITSTVATLTVRDPVILVPPMGANRTVGESLTLNVTAGGTLPLNYQWYHDDLAVPGATGSTLFFNALSGADAGDYTVQVSNVYGSVISSPVSLTVNMATTDAAFNPGWLDYAVSSLAVQADGKILVGGEFNTLGGQPRNRIGRLNPDGTLDATFNPGAGPFYPYVSHVYSLALQSDGKILVGGYFTTLGGQPRNYLGRLNPNGTPDSTFNPGANSSVSSLALQADGKILVCGYFTALGGQPRNYLGRLNPDGTLDSTFNPGADYDVHTLALQGDGKILVGGDFLSLAGQPRNSLGRLNPDGTLDSTFNPGVGGSVYSLAVQADGKILVGGAFGTLGGQPRIALGRLNPDGTLDSTFNAGAGSEEDESYVFSLAVQANGKILVGGSFSTLGGQPRNHLGRLNPDGTVDSTFNPGAGGSVSSLGLQADGKILVSGWFSTLGGQPAIRIGRLNNTGPASQSLTYDGATITWLRGGASPEVWRTAFEWTSDGLSWFALGPATRTPGGWQCPASSLPQNGVIRAQGYTVGGYGNASSGFVESTLTNAPALRVSIAREGLNVLLNWTGGQGPYQVQQITELGPSNAWQDVGAPLHTNAVSIPIGVGPKFLRVRGQ